MPKEKARSIIPAERHERIVLYVKAQGGASVTELAKIFDVTNETIRRDLAMLEDDGKLLRRRGGAVATKVADRAAPWMERSTQLLEDKTAIALEAAKCIDEGDSLLLDASTTILQLARVMPDMPLTVITNSQPVIAELASRRHVKLILLGGALDPENAGVYGPHAERMVRAFHVDKAFISCRGVHVLRGVTDISEQFALLRAQMIEQAAARYLLADHTKFESISLHIFAQLSAFHQIITDDKINPNVVKAFEKYNLPLVVAPPAAENVGERPTP